MAVLGGRPFGRGATRRQRACAICRRKCASPSTRQPFVGARKSSTKSWLSAARNNARYSCCRNKSTLTPFLLAIIAAPSQFSNRHAAHRDNRRAFAQCLRPHLPQRDQALSSPRDQDQPGTLCTSKG